MLNNNSRSKANCAIAKHGIIRVPFHRHVEASKYKQLRELKQMKTLRSDTCQLRVVFDRRLNQDDVSP